MDHAATSRRMCELINAHDLDGFGEHLADDGLVREHWGVFRALGMMQPLAAAPG